MKIDYENTEASVSGNGISELTMGVKINSKLFGMMIDGLYQNKLGSVIREIASNAYDAHVDAGIPEVPFEILIPSDIGGKLIFRDFGNGLPEEDVIKYFGTLFESKKDKDGNMIGGYGIGCKSPFAIVDEFMVTSFHAGIETTVVFVRENKGTPTFFVSGKRNSEEPSGIKITIECDNVDEIQKEIKQQLAFFPVKPILKGGTIEDEKSFFNTITRIGEVSFINGEMPYPAYVSVGPVLYPLDTGIYSDALSTTSNKTSIVYSLSIDEVDVPPDRERIYASEKNIRNIKNTIVTSNDSYDEELKKHFVKSYDYTHESYVNIVDESKNYPKGSVLLKASLKSHVFSGVKFNLLHEELNNNISYIFGKYKTTMSHYYVDENDILKISSYIFSFEALKNMITRFSIADIVLITDARVFEIDEWNKKRKDLIVIKTPKRSLEDVKEALNEILAYYKIVNTQITEIKKTDSVMFKMPPKEKGYNYNGVYYVNDGSILIISNDLRERYMSGNFVSIELNERYHDTNGYFKRNGINAYNKFNKLVGNKYPPIFLETSRASARREKKGIHAISNANQIHDIFMEMLSSKQFLEIILEHNYNISGMYSGYIYSPDLSHRLKKTFETYKHEIIELYMNKIKSFTIKEVYDIIQYRSYNNNIIDDIGDIIIDKSRAEMIINKFLGEKFK